MTRANVALLFLSIAVVLNLIVLIRGEESPGWPVAAMIFLGASGVALIAERRR